jgi:hypothetical protein
MAPLLLLIIAACIAPLPIAPEPSPTTTPTADITVCATGCDFVTLQAAIDASETAPMAVIGVMDAVHTEADIQVHKTVTIQGQGAAHTIVQAHAMPETATERVFFIQSGVTVTLRALTIRHGNPKASPESGGGILNEGTLRMKDSVVTANSGSAGGGIHNEGTLTVVNSTISHNTARGGGDSNYECQTGGGIKALVGTVTLLDSTVHHNTAIGKGGGLHIACQGTLVLVNSTVSHNTTNNDGGGVYLNGVGRFTHATISHNTAKTGGGVYIRGTDEFGLVRGRLSYTNTLIADNVARMEKYGVTDCMMGDFATLGANHHNLVGDGTCDPTYSGDPGLLPLDDNGGATQTHALRTDSPALDALPASACVLATDQRGMPRAAPCDIGAVEMETTP